MSSDLNLQALVTAIPQPLRDMLDAEARPRKFADGALIHGRNAPGRALYVVRKGAVQFRNSTEDGRFVDLITLGPRQWFGEIALLAREAPPHDAFAQGPTELGVLDQTRFFDLMDAHPALSRAMMRLLAVRLRLVFSMMDDLRTLPAPALVAKHLVWLADSDPTVSPVIAVDQATLASRLGLSRITVGKVLKQLESAGVITLGYRRISVVNADRLKAASKLR
jgi:CRP/FNR family transcriptional regulator, cyclic AMP receptor protein